MNTTIRQLQGEEMLETLYTLNSYALHPSPPLQDKQSWMEIVSKRKGMVCLATFEDDKPVSIAVSTPMTQNLRGELYPANGIWGVATDPAARRKGYCRQLMKGLMKDGLEAGKVFSNLYPFRESFYERMGYVAFPLMKIARFSTRNLSPLLKMDLGGEVRLQLIAEAHQAYRTYLTEMLRYRHGMAFFDYGDMGRVNQNLLWVAVAEFEGKIEGIMLFRTTGEEVTKYNFVASRFYYLSSRARYLLLNWIARHIDQAEQAELWLPEEEYPETWLTDMEIKQESTIRPAMCRVVNVEKISGMYVGEGDFSCRIIDPLCRWNEGTWRFNSRDGRLEVSKAAKADFDLSIQGLIALIAGMVDPQDFPWRGWGNLNPEQQAGLRVMFPAMRPYLHEMF